KRARPSSGLFPLMRSWPSYNNNSTEVADFYAAQWPVFTPPLTQWVNLMELGATYAWSYNIKGKYRGKGQVVTQVAFQGGRHETIARLIGDAGKGQQARMRDSNPFNLRWSNIRIDGDLTTAEGRVGTANSDARSRMWDGSKTRSSLAGKRYGDTGH
ncbi:MAG: hypothetical protein L3J36_15670, partial [Rhodobacteraceae bacterium]|nr:hypothetical protein [Paracoccaceae bacterium]